MSAGHVVVDSGGGEDARWRSPGAHNASGDRGASTTEGEHTGEDGQADDEDLLTELDAAMENPVVTQALQPGVDVEAELRSVENQLREVESEAVADFVREGATLSSLHEDMQQCGELLAEMESMLEKHVSKLSEFSEDIHRLQQTTSAASTRVTSRSAAEAHLSAFVDEIILPPSMVKHVVEGQVGTDAFAGQLAMLDKKIAFLSLEDTKTSVASGEILPQAKQLLGKAVQRVQSFLHEKVALLRRPNTNVQIIKENVLLKHKALFEFLMDHSFPAYIKVRDDYVDTMLSLYNALFTKYIQGLVAQKEEVAVRGELLVEAPTSFKAFFDTLSSVTKSAQSNRSVFSTGDRIKTLQEIDSPALILAVVANSKDKILFEELERSVVRLLLETCTSEHIYCAELFGAGQGRMFDTLFATTVDLILSNLQAHVSQSHDTIGLLLTLKIHEAQRREMRRRKIADLNNFFTRAEIIIKPRFKELFDENLASVSSANPKELFQGNNDTSPHVVTRRYAEFVGALALIMKCSSEDNMVREALKHLRSEHQGLMNSISLNYKASKNRYVYLINNCDLVLSIFEELTVSGDDNLFFQDLLSGHILAYAEHELSEHFAEYINFIRAKSTMQERRVRAVLREFAANWRSGVSHIRANTLRVFPNFKTGSEILKMTLTELLKNHRKAESLVERDYPNLKSEMVTSTAISYEIHKDEHGF